MEKSEYPKEIRKRAFAALAKNPAESFAVGFAFTLVSIAVAAVAAFDFSIFLVAMALIEFPMVYCLHLYCADIRHGHGLVGGLFFRRYGAYFTQSSGVYRAFATFAKAIIVYFVSYGIFSLIYVTARQSEAQMASELQELNQIMASGAVNSLQNFMAESVAVVPAMRFCNGIGAAASVFYLVHALGYFGVKTYLHRGAPMGQGRSVTAMYRFGARENWAYFHKLYYSLFWPGTVLFLLGFGLGFGISNIYLYGTFYPLAIGLGASALLLGVFFPYFGYATELLFRIEEKHFASASLRFAKFQLNNLRAASRMSDEEFQKISADLDKAEEKNRELTAERELDPFGDFEKEEPEEGGEE
ncbi:MAG: hypothetical protein K6F32_01530 [Bacilli bacterium]|nr:hypothetical protein [Bacilli bacterium]